MGAITSAHAIAMNAIASLYEGAGMAWGGAFAAFFLLQYGGLDYWWALVIVPLVVGLLGIVIERLFLQRLYKLDHLYGLLLTFGLALIIEGTFRNFFGSSGLPYAIPTGVLHVPFWPYELTLAGGNNLGFMFLPNYRAWVVVFSLAVCLTTWFVIERTRLGANLRAATENPTLVRAFGINVPRMITNQVVRQTASENTTTQAR